LIRVFGVEARASARRPTETVRKISPLAAPLAMIAAMFGGVVYLGVALGTRFTMVTGDVSAPRLVFTVASVVGAGALGVAVHRRVDNAAQSALLTVALSPFFAAAAWGTAAFVVACGAEKGFLELLMVGVVLGGLVGAFGGLALAPISALLARVRARESAETTDHVACVAGLVLGLASAGALALAAQGFGPTPWDVIALLVAGIALLAYGVLHRAARRRWLVRVA
jgi:hypothetical protein